jgi:N4-gp56 family major capsid protein
MAVVEFAAGDTLANELWEQRLNVEVIEHTYLNQFIGTGLDAMIQEKIEPNKSPGDQVTMGLRGVLGGAGKLGNEVLKGNSEAFTTKSDVMTLNLLRHSVAVPAGMTIDAQRVPYELREEAYDALRQWYTDRLDDAMFNQLAGNTAQTDVRFTGNQAVTGPSANNVFRANGGSNATDQAVGADTTAVLTLPMIDALVERAGTMRKELSQPMIRPISIMGRPYYVMFIHDFQKVDLRRDAGAGGWLTIQKEAMSGGAISGNALFTGAIGVYNNVILHSTPRIPQGVHSSTGAAVANTRRAVFCGAQAAWMAWGQGYGQTSFRWVEELEDFGHQLEVAVGSIWGMKKSIFNSQDFATLTLTTRAASHAT